ncbi:2-hydroxychromene-2-carboxylate isomerase [Umezawaea endophytica]|uniref:2-hydroxychromene-2-carboxylate isomerase n=1 Tax=Umezawaea endophytica TaxID=1654476 RepID=A0A9X2VVJ9_9PSEU|nr:2-hydroxychromene-2-carboxylate isomerase [Umezawaea endophytica]MCS7483576.1 2-hydroxychromene-2-carboxylate isomerase [Umezawaea endophytica]
MPSKPKKQPRWYFSLRSPYSWFAYHDMRAEYPDVLDAVRWLPTWEPDEISASMLAEARIELPYVPMSVEKGRYILQDVRRMAKDRGLAMTWPVDRNPVWEVSHLAYLAAEEEGAGREFVAAAYRARWEHGRDISDPDVMSDIAGDLGLDPVRLSTAAQDTRLRELAVQSLNEVWRDGVFGVPFFIVGHEKFWGVDRLPQFVDALRDLRLREDPGTWQGLVPAGPVSDMGHAGGCG